LSEVEVILKQEAGVKAHESESPPTVGLRAGAFAEVGTLILTNKRLVYISKGGASRAAAWAMGGALAARAVEKNVSKAEIDDLMKYKGSYSTALQNITRVEAGKKLGAAYLRVDSVGSEKPSHAYVFGSGWSNDDEWVKAINSAKESLNSTPINSTIISSPQNTSAIPSQKICQKCGTPDSSEGKFCSSCGTPFAQSQTETSLLPPPPPPPTSPSCPYCKSQIRYIQQYQRWYCDKEKRYV
jgi:hypothetical protein